MTMTLAFDIYGTVIDTQGVLIALQGLVGDGAVGFSRTWRDKQLEYTFRRGLMGRYKNFDTCTRDALDYTCALYKADMTAGQKADLMALYRNLPAFEDAKEGLDQLKAEGYRLFAFTNGTDQTVDSLLASAGVREHFVDIVSVDSLRTFKPDPVAYHYLLDRAGVSSENACLISSNPFDIIGAAACGMKSAWVRRLPEVVFDPWEIEPDLMVGSLTALAGALTALDHSASCACQPVPGRALN